MNPTKISYLDFTWNPLAMLCTPVSQACTNCWHLAMANRLASNPTIPADVRACYAGERAPLLIMERLTEPLRRKKPAVIGVQFMGDLFHEDIPTHVIRSVLAAAALATQHTFLILTKRSRHMAKLLGDRQFRGDLRYMHRTNALRQGLPDPKHNQAGWDDPSFPLPSNLIGMVTAEDQEQADRRIPDLLATPFAVRGLSAEPLLGGIDLAWAISRNRLDVGAGILQRGHFAPGLEKIRRLDWVIVGGETGLGARPMHPDWATGIRDQCQAAGVPFFFKSWGAWKVAATSFEVINLAHASRNKCCQINDSPLMFWRVGKKRSGHLLDGREHREFPT